MKHVDELAALAEMVRTIPEKDFCMSFWRLPNDCGFVGCAIGHGIARGVVSELVFVDGNVELPGSKCCDVPAVALHFGITVDQATFLFTPGTYFVNGYRPTREAVAARIEQFLADHAPERLIELKPPLALAPDVRVMIGERVTK